MNGGKTADGGNVVVNAINQTTMTAREALEVAYSLLGHKCFECSKLYENHRSEDHYFIEAQDVEGN